ncbi:hypothetical protein ES707_16594 [subsurface metagenome]
MGSVILWGWDSTKYVYRKLLVDADGHLQLDVLSSALPLGAMTDNMGLQIRVRIGATIGPAAGSVNAQLALIRGYIDGIEAALGHCYGYDGGAWQRLRVETAANANLRVALYGADSRAYVGAGSLAFTYATPGLQTFATLYGDDGTNVSRVGMLLEGADAVANTLNTLGVASMLYGYDGGAWNRLRVDASYNLKVAVAAVPSVSSATTTKVAIGAVSTVVLAANANRIYAEFVNDSDETIYLDESATAVMNEGIRLNAQGGSFEIGSTNLYTGAITAICASGGKNLTVTEG